MAEYVLSEKALEDLNNIWIFTAEKTYKVLETL